MLGKKIGCISCSPITPTFLGTNEKLFDPEDVDGIKGLPFGPEFTRLIEAVNTLLGIKAQEVDDAIKVAEKSD
jgi:hypothetical protein